MRDDPVVHVGDAMGEMENSVVVSDHDDRAVRMNGGRGKKLHDGFAALVIQRGGGLVTNDEAWFVNQCTGEGDALLLTA
jgi:hypothetical protein